MQNTLQKSAIHGATVYCQIIFILLIRIKPLAIIKEHYKLFKRREPPEYDSAVLADFIMERFSNWLNGYTKAFNKNHLRKGALFMDYTKRSIIETDNAFGKVVHYVHSNPVHHEYVNQAEQWDYSSYKGIISSSPTRLLRNELLNWFGGRELFIKFHQQPIYRKLADDLEH